MKLAKWTFAEPPALSFFGISNVIHLKKKFRATIIGDAQFIRT